MLYELATLATSATGRIGEIPRIQVAGEQTRVQDSP